MKTYTIGWKVYAEDSWQERTETSLVKALYWFLWALWRFPSVDMAYREESE